MPASVAARCWQPSAASLPPFGGTSAERGVALPGVLDVADADDVVQTHGHREHLGECRDIDVTSSDTSAIYWPCAGCGFLLLLETRALSVAMSRW